MLNKVIIATRHPFAVDVADGNTEVHEAIHLARTLTGTIPDFPWMTALTQIAEMTFEMFRSVCEAHGLKCVRQELINWRGRWLIDCFTTLTRAGSKWEGTCRIVRNPRFMREAELIRQQTPKASEESQS